MSPTLNAEMERAPLDSVATGRSENFFAADLARSEGAMAAAIAGKRVLVIGGAGSIGSSTIRTLAPFAPKSLVVVDQDENGLAELARLLRSDPAGVPIANLRLLPLDYGGPVMRRLLTREPAFDAVLHFAAIKHVRSEKDDFSVLQMVETNLIKLVRLIDWLAASGFAGRLFAVSTDKAANPTSFMGATKRVMEHVLFQVGAERLPQAVISSARFANVAFSNGSLLQSFENRLAAGQALAAPRDTRRYFVSRPESGAICAIAATAFRSGALLAPKLEPERHLRPLEEVARAFLARAGYEAAIYEEEDAAKRAVSACVARGRWPLLLTPLDTGGEKPFEEFVAEGEAAEDVGLSALTAIRRRPVAEQSLREALAGLEALLADAAAASPKDVVKALIAQVEPAFLETHRDSPRTLDERA